jgi:hypothetical protein
VVMIGDLTIRTLDEDHCVATWDRALIQIWMGNVTSANVENLASVARAYLDQRRMPISSIAIVEPTSPPPSDHVRRELSSFYRELAPRMKEQIVVAEGSGFRSALVRGVGLTLSTLAPRSLPFKFVSTVRDATFMIGPHLSPTSGGGDGLQSAIDDVRRQIAERVARSKR